MSTTTSSATSTCTSTGSPATTNRRCSRDSLYGLGAGPDRSAPSPVRASVLGPARRTGGCTSRRDGLAVDADHPPLGPGAGAALAGGGPGRLVTGEVVERVTVVRHLLGPVAAGAAGECRLLDAAAGGGRSGQWRPVGDAGRVAGRRRALV